MELYSRNTEQLLNHKCKVQEICLPLLAEICVFPFWRPPHWIFYFRLTGTWFVSSFVDLPDTENNIFSRWNCLVILSTTWDMCIPGLAAVILDFLLPVNRYVICISLIRWLACHGKHCLAVGIVLLTCLRADVYVFPVVAAAILELLVSVRSCSILTMVIG